RPRRHARLHRALPRRRTHRVRLPVPVADPDRRRNLVRTRPTQTSAVQKRQDRRTTAGLSHLRPARHLAHPRRVRSDHHPHHPAPAHLTHVRGGHQWPQSCTSTPSTAAQKDRYPPCAATGSKTAKAPKSTHQSANSASSWPDWTTHSNWRRTPEMAKCVSCERNEAVLGEGCGQCYEPDLND